MPKATRWIFKLRVRRYARRARIERLMAEHWGDEAARRVARGESQDGCPLCKAATNALRGEPTQ